MFYGSLLELIFIFGSCNVIGKAISLTEICKATIDMIYSSQKVMFYMYHVKFFQNIQSFEIL